MEIYLEMDHETVDFYQDALQTYGLPSQVGLVNEECAELIVALNHVVRGKTNLEDVAGEIADVMVMLGQLLTVVEAETVEAIAEQKLRTAKARLHIYKVKGGPKYEDGYSRHFKSVGRQKVDDSEDRENPISGRTHVQRDDAGKADSQ